MNRTDLLNELYAARTRLEAALERLDPAQMTQPDLPGGWSVKDLLAHLGWWENYAIADYQRLKQGKSLDIPANVAAVDAINARVLAEFRARDLEEVRKYEQSAYRAILNLIETSPEEDLFDPQRFAALSIERPLSDWIMDNSAGHFDEHLPSLAAKLAEDQAALRPPAPAPGELPQDVGSATPVTPNPIVQRAGEFLQSAGRDIDQALYQMRFGTLPTEDVMAVLARYQNPDGGFAGLEVDIAAPQSNPFATEIALRMFTWIDPPRTHPVVRRTVDYLESTQDEDGSWRFTPEIYQHSLAPWFQGWQWPNLNPSCTTAGLLKELGLGSDRLHARVQALFDRLANPADLAGNDFYQARPYALYFQTEWNFPQADFYRWGVVWWLVRQHLANPNMDATHFMEFAMHPDSAIASRLPAPIVQAKLDQLIAEQSADGGWPTPYDPRWRPWNTIQNLLILRAYGKV